MESNKHSRRAVHRSFLTIWVLILTLIVATGVAWGRYSTTLRQGLNFQASAMSTAMLWGITAPEERLAGNWKEMPVTWTLDESGESRLAFCISNGTSESLYSEEDIRVYLRLTATESIDPELVTISLIGLSRDTDGTVSDTDTRYMATAIAVNAGSDLYEQMGPGHQFYFYDDDGEELSWDLPGGSLSVQNMVLSVDGPADTGLLRLSVVQGG